LQFLQRIDIDNQNNEIAPKPVPAKTSAMKLDGCSSPTLNPLNSNTPEASDNPKKSHIFQNWPERVT